MHTLGYSLPVGGRSANAPKTNSIVHDCLFAAAEATKRQPGRYLPLMFFPQATTQRCFQAAGEAREAKSQISFLTQIPDIMIPSLSLSRAHRGLSLSLRAVTAFSCGLGGRYRSEQTSVRISPTRIHVLISWRYEKFILFQNCRGREKILDATTKCQRSNAHGR
jgi:hypothetical protein